MLRNSIDELRSEIEVLRTLSQETHYRIRILEEEFEESRANESGEEESEEEKLQDENIQIIQKRRIDDANHNKNKQKEP